MADRKWKVLESTKIDDDRELVLQMWPHGECGGNHENEHHVAIVYTHPEEGWSTTKDNNHFWGDNAKQRASIYYGLQREVHTQ
jgi:hypothetical protein